MKKRSVRIAAAAASLLMLLAAASPEAVKAETVWDEHIVVSLGDSFSAGEGIEPFYGQDLTAEQRISEQDWLGHRSEKSWPGRLVFGNYALDPMKEFRVTGGEPDFQWVQWHFGASSGAVTADLKNKQDKPYYVHENFRVDSYGNTVSSGKLYEGTAYMDPQLNIFKDLTGQVDYVTLTIGGNDVGFANVIKAAAVHCAYLDFGSSGGLKNEIDKAWNNIDTHKKNIKQAYKDVQAAAGEQAVIIVAGYPRLLDEDGAGALFNKKEAQMINENVTDFNEIIEGIVKECADEGMKIHFVSVEEEFKGHGAGSDNPYLNSLILHPMQQELEQNAMFSAYSMHPNNKGAAAYARCVQKLIDEELDPVRTYCTVYGLVVNASDGKTPVSGAEIALYSNEEGWTMTDDIGSSGMYMMPKLIDGTYSITVTAEGYLDFTYELPVSGNDDYHAEPIRLIKGTSAQTGTASGYILDAESGKAVKDPEIEVYKGWNNTSGEPVKTLTADQNGKYSFEGNLGYYTLLVKKRGYITETRNVVVQRGVTENQNVVSTRVMPVEPGADGGYRFVLTWNGEPKDLNAHLTGYYEDSMEQWDVCADDKAVFDPLKVAGMDCETSSGYGPETISLIERIDRTYEYTVEMESDFDEGIAASGAQVRVYHVDECVAVFNMPANTSGGDRWAVFSIDEDGKILPVNLVSASPDSGLLPGV